MFRRLPMIEFKSGFGNELPGLMIEGLPKRIVWLEGCQLEEVVEVVMGAAVEVVEVVGAEAKAKAMQGGGGGGGRGSGPRVPCIYRVLGSRGRGRGAWV